MFRLATLVLLIAQAALAADDLPSAARELARRTAAFLGGRVPSETWRNRSALPDSELDRARREFHAALADSAPNPGAEIRLTLSENASQYLLIEEARAGEESQTWIVSWNRNVPAGLPSPALTLDRKLVWEQDEPILDLAVWDTGLLVLSPARLALYGRQGTQWSLLRQLTLPGPHNWPRDPRARLRRTGSHIEIFLPGTACQGDTVSSLSLECHPSSDPWVLDSGNRSLLLAYFTTGRNYFDGRVVLQEGNHKTVPPFYSAAALEQPDGTSWLLALTDGQTELFNSAWEPVTSIPNWGSDIVTLNTCAAGLEILAGRPGDNSQPDTLQTFSVANGSALPASSPLPFAGAITALWPTSPSSALAVAYDPTAHKYRAYVVTPACN
ncbi:MAG TPA: hypothetical protein VH640_20505 [Bryobacteraceae bacterium]|jgi:hypothetical protein